MSQMWNRLFAALYAATLGRMIASALGDPIWKLGDLHNQVGWAAVLGLLVWFALGAIAPTIEMKVKLVLDERSEAA